MTARGLFMAAAILASAPVDSAAACHHYRYWGYPTPQRCGVHQSSSNFIRPSAQVRASSRKYLQPVADQADRIEIPLPALDLTDYALGDPDPELRARLMLRGALDVAHAR